MTKNKSQINFKHQIPGSKVATSLHWCFGHCDLEPSWNLWFEICRQACRLAECITQKEFPFSLVALCQDVDRQAQ